MVRAVVRGTLTACRDAPRETAVRFCASQGKKSEREAPSASRDTSRCVRKISRAPSTLLDALTRMLYRSSILAEVQNSGNNKLPSNKNVLVLGKYLASGSSSIALMLCAY